MKILYYLKQVKLALLPRELFLSKKRQLEELFVDRNEEIEQRVSYYLKLTQPFTLPEDSTTISRYKRRGFTSYYYDLKEFLYYFPRCFKFAYYFGDETHIEAIPTLFKARPIEGEVGNSVLFKLDKRRHFRFVDDSLPYREKRNLAVFRGAVTQPHRLRFMKAMFDHPLVDAGQSNPSKEYPEWQKPFMSIEEQLKYKFMICLEGNDVASNLKWAMSSNSLVITPKMVYETWFMEGKLVAGQHYVEVADDFSDLEEKMHYYITHPEEAEKIISQAHAYLAPFRDEDLESLVCIKTLERYFELSGQKPS